MPTNLFSALGLLPGFLCEPLQRVFQRRIGKLHGQFNQPFPSGGTQRRWGRVDFCGGQGDLHTHLNSSNLATRVLE